MRVPRNCTEIPAGDGDRHAHGERRSRPLKEYREAPAYVLVGDPGAGKTTAFETEREALGDDACLVTARDFLTFEPQDHPEWGGKVLFIDGLDEVRAGSSDVRTPFDQVRARLDALGKPRFRLSCREADWLGENDRKHLESVSPDSQVKVLRLDPLTDADIASILGAKSDIPDARAFVEEARQRGVEGLLENPQTLEMLADVVAGGAGWPKGRMETFEKACRQMVREHNEEHEAAQESGSPPSPEQLLDASGRLCALQLISGGAGYTLRGEPDEEYPTRDRCDYDSQALGFALSTKLFKGVSTNRFSPVHRHIAEFLGGRYLAAVIQDGLPARRVIALMEGEDGTVVTEMRGLSAWLAAHSRDARADLIERDPIGVGLYGDIGEFSHKEKLALLESLQREGKRLGSVWWTAGALGALGTPDMEPVIKEVLTDSGREEDHQAFAEFVLDVLRSSGPRPGLSEVLLDIVRDDSRARRVSAMALSALLIYPGNRANSTKLQELLVDIRTGRVLDPSNLQLGMLLSHLYPRELPPSEVWDYLRDDPLRELGYSRFWRRELLDKSSDEEIAELLDSLQIRLVDLRPVLNGYLFRELPAKLLSRGLEKHGHELEPKRLYDWLSVGSEQSVSAHDKESVDHIRSWLEDHPEIQKAIVMEGLVRCPESDFRRHAVSVRRRWYGASPPSDFGLWCLEQAVTMANERPLAAEHLLEGAVEAHRSHIGNAGLSLEVLQEQARKKAKLWNHLNQLLSPSPTLKKYLEDEKQRRQEEEKERQQWFDHVRSNRTALLENRAAPRLLYDMAGLYFGRKAVEERLRGDRGLIDAVLRGLRGTIERKDVPDLEEILRLREQNEMHPLALPFLAGIAEVEKETDVSQWDDDRVRKAIAFYYSSIPSNHKPKWYRRLLAERPEIVAEVHVQFAVSGFRSGREDIDKLSELALDHDYTQVARHASLPLLRAFPTRCKATQMQDLKYLLRAALQSADRASLRDLIGEKCSQKSIDDTQRVYWLATGIIVEPEGYSEGLEEFVQGREDRISHLMVFLESLGKFTSDELDNPLRESLIRLVGNYAKPDQFWNDESGRQYTGSEVGASEFVHGLIKSLSTSLEEDAIAALGRLLGDKTLSHWHDVLSRAQDEQRVIHRDATYRHPDIEQICWNLQGGMPANPADLAALLMDRLLELAVQIWTGNTDGWRQYWNADSHGRPEEPRHEALCRNELLDALRQHLPPSVDAQPEGHYANDKRADIRVSCGDFQVPVEAKKNTHRDLWSAPRNQLIAKYTTDPATGGHGIYLVFWFGRKGTPPPPTGPPPATAEELQERLQATLTPVEARKISVCVIDVSRPSRPDE